MLEEAIVGFFQQLPRMRWTDYLDILLVAFLIYQIIPRIRTSGGSRIIKVVVIVFVMSSLADVLDLYALSYIFDQFLTVGLIALVVLFQPELRRMIDHFGNVKISGILSGNKSAGPIDGVISQVVKACDIMSQERVGALIAFSRGNPLVEYEKTGTTIDGEVSEQLIRNIFFTNASLHDGAMIIRNGRIASAGCVLPLSDSNRLSADLGTRHRAGVGLSEASDAVVIIVSEETGTISVAVGGMLKRHLAPQTLEKLLHNELVADNEDKKNAWKDWILKHRKHKQEGDNPDEE